MKRLTMYILSRFGGNVVTREEVKEACRRFRANHADTINFMISYGYFIRILRGIYYVKTLDEFKLRKPAEAYRVISLGLNRLGIDWYFGLYTALRLNGLTHEFSKTIFVVNDSIFRHKEIEVAGEKVRFVKLRDKLFGFGVVEKNGFRFSDPEKTVLDFIYVFRYRGVPEERIVSMIDDYSKNLKNEKIKSYLRFYPKTVEGLVRDAGLI